MLQRNVVIQLTEDIDNLSVSGSKFVIIGSNSVYAQLIEIGKEGEGYIEEFTDKITEYINTGSIVIIGKNRIEFGKVYWNYREKFLLVPVKKVRSKTTKEVILIYNLVNKKIKSSDVLSNGIYFITMNEFLRYCEKYKG